ncbi:MAG: enoyl-CoA hydratase-related protein, partial [bacterium]|nr:enoyl-CoA hydratase-related protein [bacterium]
EQFALGGGYEIPLACDLIIGNGKVGLPEKGLGILPGWLGTQTLIRRAGLEKGLWMILGAEIVEADTPWINIPLKKTELTWAKLKTIADNTKKRRFEPLKYNFAQKLLYLGKFFELWYKVKTGKEPASALLALQAIWRGNNQDLQAAAGIEWQAILAAFETKEAEKGIRHFLETGKHLYK